MSFESLGLSESIVKAVEKKGYTKPSVIQEKAIPLILERRDVLGSAQTGTGKTAGFTLPLLQILSQGKKLRRKPIRALILTPTRELAAQVLDNIKAYSHFLNIKSTVVFGGVNINPQISTLRRGVDVLVATPGRLLDLHNQKTLSLAKIEILVLDEADRMLDMGFLRDIKRILSLMPSKRQNLLFSATFSREIKELANRILHNPATVEATPENTTVEKINQRMYHVNNSRKASLVIKLISEGDWKQVLIFTKTKYGANRLSEKLVKNGITASAIHGNKTQNARTKSLKGFKSGDIHVLVATDIAARGLDIPLLPHVINYELPNVPQDYVHRIGRTGRAGASGEAISIVSLEEMPLVKGIEKLVGQTFPMEILKDFEPNDKASIIEKKDRGNTRFSGKKATENKGQYRRKSKRYNSNSRKNKKS